MTIIVLLLVAVAAGLIYYRVRTGKNPFKGVGGAVKSIFSRSQKK